MSQVGNDLHAAHQILESGGNCAFDLYQPTTGAHCAWGALNRAVFATPVPTEIATSHDPRINAAFGALYKHLPKEAQDEFDGVLLPVVMFNNRNPGQPVIDLFAKAAANEGYEALRFTKR